METKYLSNENHIMLKKLFLQVEAITLSTQSIFLWQIVTPAFTSIINPTGELTNFNQINFYEKLMHL